jgi:hypothetical protein
VKNGWFLPVFIREEDKLEWWSGPIRSGGGRGRGSGSQVSGGGGVCKSLWILGDIKLLFLFFVEDGTDTEFRNIGF